MSQAELAKHVAIQCECKKDSLRQNQSGEWKITFLIHPQETPQRLMTDLPGQRYMCVLVPLDDNDSPLPPTVNSGPELSVSPEVEPAVSDAVRERQKWGELPLRQRAAILCGEPGFQDWIGASNSEQAADWLRERCGVQSRKEIEHDTAAGRSYLTIEHDYKNEQRITNGREYL